MTRVRTRWHFSRLLLLFSSSEALQARHCLTLLLLGLTSLRTALSCDEKTRPQIRDLSAYPGYLEIRGYLERRDLDAPRAIPEWMQREKEASSMADQSASDVASDDHSSDSLRKRDCDESHPSVIKQAYFDNDVFASRDNDQPGIDRVRSPNDYPTQKSDVRLSDPSKIRQVRNGIDFQSMKQSEESANNWLGNLVRKRRGVSTLQLASRYTVNQAVNKVQFRDSDNEASLTILDGQRPSASSLPETSVHDRDAEGALIEVPIDRLHSREAPSVNHPTQPSRRDHNGVSSEAERTGLNADNLFAEIPEINRANERTNDYSVRRSSRGNQLLASERDIDVAAAEHRDDLAGDRSDRAGVVGFWVARQTHLNRRNILYALDNRNDVARGSESGSADRLHESDGVVINDVRNDFSSANPNDSDVNAIAIDAVADDLGNTDTNSMENQVELDGISKIDNQTNIDSDSDGSSNLGGAEIRPTNCRSAVCSKSNDDDQSLVRTKKFDEADKSNVDQEYEDENHFTRVISTAPDNDSGTDIDINSEAPFIGFEGSQKFPVKINHKSPSVPSQVEKFDRRHFGPHREDVLEETSTWYPSTVPPDLPKSPSRDVLHRKTNDDSDDVTDEMDEADNRSVEKTTEMDARRNDTYDESWLFNIDIPEEHLSGKSNSDGKLAVTSNIADNEFENATRGKNDSESRVEIDVPISSARPIEKINITILGLFEMTNRTVPRPEGSSELQAAKLAVKRVNELDILKRFRMRLIYNDTKVTDLNCALPTF